MELTEEQRAQRKQEQIETIRWDLRDLCKRMDSTLTPVELCDLFDLNNFDVSDLHLLLRIFHILTKDGRYSISITFDYGVQISYGLKAYPEIMNRYCSSSLSQNSILSCLKWMIEMFKKDNAFINGVYYLSETFEMKTLDDGYSLVTAKVRTEWLPTTNEVLAQIKMRENKKVI